MSPTKLTTAQHDTLEVLVAAMNDPWPWRSAPDVAQARQGRALTPPERAAVARNATRPLEALVALGYARQAPDRPRHALYRATPAGRDHLLTTGAEALQRVGPDRVHLPGIDPEPDSTATLTDRYGVKWRAVLDDAKRVTGWGPEGTDMAFRWTATAMMVAGPFAGPRRRERAAARTRAGILENTAHRQAQAAALEDMARERATVD